MHSLVIDTFTFYYRPMGYFLIFIGLLIEGEFILFIAAFLTHQGVFDLGGMFIVVVSGVLIGDILWYFVGTRLHGTNYWWQKWFDRIAKPFDRHLVERPSRTIFISKFTYGFHRAILIRAGMLRIAAGEFLKADALSAFIWIGVVGGLGYYGASAFSLLARQYLRLVEVGLALGLISFFLLLHFVSHYFQKKL